MGDYKLGQTVQTQDGRKGVIRFIGTTSFATGQWVGIELPDDSGKNDGAVQGERYFTCQPGFGIFVRKESNVKILKQPEINTTSYGVKPTNGAARPPRPSSGITPEVARKRQSLMGAGSVTGSRLSIRSPTKSPTKAAHSSASSNASTPRTGTPATTARTSDSSNKSRLSVNGRTSMGPPAPRSNTGSRASLSGAALNKMKSGADTKPTIRPSVTPSKLSSLPPTQKGDHHDPTRSLEEAGGEKALLETNVEADEDNQNSRIIHDSQEDNEDEEVATIGGQTTLTAKQVNGMNTNTGPSRAPPSTGLESRAQSQREVEQLKAKIRTLERKIFENREKIKSVDSLQSDKDRYENIIQALQEKLKSNKQNISELQQKCEEFEKSENHIADARAEHDSELEMALLDKEMAEERADNFEMELNELKMKHQELELESEILREENKELGSGISPEEKAGAGWLQMERERERLRDALVMLRDMSQQTENDLRQQVKELQRDLDESLGVSNKYHDTVEQLSRAEAANRHLKEQLEAADSNEELNLALEAERDQKQQLIDQLRDQIRVLQEEVEVNDELEAYHLATEKDLQHEIDDRTALLNEQERNNLEQNKMIEDMEYTLTKFRDVVAGLQSDIDELRRSKNITEIEAHEMSSRSRAMMDLNRQLQTSAAKTQLKAIDLEIGRINAEESAQHLAIVQMFVPDAFDSERNPTLGLLCLQRIRSKASLVMSVLLDRLKDRPHLTQEDPFSIIETVQKLGSIKTLADRFVQFINTCNIDEFARLQNLIYELEPVERSMNTWIDCLKRDELSKDGPDHLSRMIGVLTDLIDKFVPDRLETRSSQILATSSMLETYCDGTTNALNSVLNAIQAKVGSPRDEDEEASHFDRKVNQFISKTRTIRYLAGKASHNLSDLQSRNMISDDSTLSSFGSAEQLAHDLSQLLGKTGINLFHHLWNEERNEPWTYHDVSILMEASLAHELEQSGLMGSDAFDLISRRLSELQTKVDELVNRSSDVTFASEFEKLPAPWIIRADEIKKQKVISQETKDELHRLKMQVQDMAVTLLSKDKELEEKQIRIELLESRTKETKQNFENVKKLETEMQQIRLSRDDTARELEQIRREYNQLSASYEVDRVELEMLKTNHAASGDKAVMGGALVLDHAASAQFEAHINVLKAEIANLQAAVRFLELENYRARIPGSDMELRTSPHAWLDPSNLSRPPKVPSSTATARQVYADLMDLAASTKPILLMKQEHNQTKSSWRAMKDTPRYKALQQREELDRWLETKNHLMNGSQARHSRGQRSRKLKEMTAHFSNADIGLEKKLDDLAVSDRGRVEIVGSPPG